MRARSMGPEETDIDVPLAALIETLREQLERAMREGAGNDLRFGLGEIDLELKVAVTRRKGMKGGIAISVLTLGAERGTEQGSTHSIHLRLQPHDDILIAKQDEPQPE
jgi:hypothetical protein